MVNCYVSDHVKHRLAVSPKEEQMDNVPVRVSHEVFLGVEHRLPYSTDIYRSIGNREASIGPTHYCTTNTLRRSPARREGTDEEG